MVAEDRHDDLTETRMLEDDLTLPAEKPDREEFEDRGSWQGKFDFLFSCLSFAVGLGNVWRFPYQCYKNGGGAFLFPFIFMLGVLGLPLLFLETAFGQFASTGVVSIWKASPIFKGIGGAMFMVSLLVSCYYNVIIAWAIFYMFASFNPMLPWASCNKSWNSASCHRWGDTSSVTSENGVYSNPLVNGTTNSSHLALALPPAVRNMTTLGHSITSKSSSDEYFHNHMLEISEGFHDMGLPRWQLVLCLLLAWMVICICLIRGIRTSGRVVYFTTTFPYLVLIILLIRGVTLPGSGNGILYYLTPNWERLLSPSVWGDAAVQIFFSLAPGWGGLITLSSYNSFRNNCLKDAYIVAIGDCITSVFAGFVIFSIIGYMAHELGVDVDQVADEGAGLAFIIYPEAITRLPVSPLWAILFFLMLITLGLGTQFAIVNTVHTTIIDAFPHIFHKVRQRSYLMIGLCTLSFFIGLSCTTRVSYLMIGLCTLSFFIGLSCTTRVSYLMIGLCTLSFFIGLSCTTRVSYLMIGLCTLSFFIGLSCTTRGGMYVLQLMDSYCATYSVLIIALVESIALSWVYGYDRLAADIKLMIGVHIGWYWKVTWKFISPITLVTLLVFSIVKFQPNKYRGYEFPLTAELMGCGLTLLSVICIPLGALHEVLKTDSSLSIMQRIKLASQPASDWGHVSQNSSNQATPSLARNNKSQQTATSEDIPLTTVHPDNVVITMQTGLGNSTANAM
ncbi:Sodium- and chloride-dependent glycine transporter 1 [Lamellibrachia satsuma]|nr:Sodium- and chloride-dependent glycine transporter 1 [Lamellibrachia satsuma]